MKIWTIACSAILAFLAIPAAGMGPGSRPYDSKTETTVRGTVEEVRTVTGRHGWNGLHLSLKTASGTLDIHVGPASYVASKKFELAKGDEIEVTGSRIRVDGADAIVARQIRKGDETLTLRNADGVPMWAGPRRR
jgi:hypothetical protein